MPMAAGMDDTSIRAALDKLRRERGFLRSATDDEQAIHAHVAEVEPPKPECDWRRLRITDLDDGQ